MNAVRRSASGYLVAAFSDLGTVRGRSGMLAVGHHARIKMIRHGGAVHMARGAMATSVQGDAEVIIGAGCHVARDVRSGGRVVVQAGARVGAIRAQGDVMLLGDAHVGDVHAGGDIIIVGDPMTGALVPGGRVTTRPW